jgi:hypothetical protein
MASKIKVDQIEGSAGSTITIPTGQTLTVTDGLAASTITSGTLSSDRLPTVPATKGGTGLTSLGTANQVIAVNSGASALEFQNISSDYVKIAETQITSAVAQVDFNNTVLTSTYKSFWFTCHGLSGSGSDLDFVMKVSIDNGSNFETNFSGTMYHQLNNSSSGFGWSGNHTAGHRIFEDANTGAGSVNYARVHLMQSEGGTNDYNATIADAVTRHANNGNYYGYNSFSYYPGTGGTINFVRFYDGSGSNLDDGTIRVYGVK